jgi:signal transduction histidine kinase
MLGRTAIGCDAAAMSSTAVSPDLRTVGLRVAGFLVTVVAVVLVGLGSLLEWIEVGLDGASIRALAQSYVGVDIVEGKITLALAVVAVVTVLIARVGSLSSRRWAALVVVLAGIGVLLATGTLALTALDRFAPTAADEVRLQAALWLSMAGGVGIVLGGLMTLAWARRGSAADAETVP